MRRLGAVLISLLAACGGGDSPEPAATTTTLLSGSGWLDTADEEMQEWDDDRNAVLDALIANSPNVRKFAVDAVRSARRFRISLPDVESVGSEDEQEDAEVLVEALEDYEDVAKRIADNPRSDLRSPVR